MDGPMKKHFTHIIEREAVKLFKDALREEFWTVYDIDPDYGKDHKVELIEGGEHTGRIFWVQLKGQKTVKPLQDGTISFSLEAKDLDYFLKLSEPMFLVVIDVTKKVGYWVFVQEYVHKKLSNLDWRKQHHIQIHLPSTNRLADLGRFREAVLKSFPYMIRRSFDADLRSEQQHLERIDPRFKLNITAGSAGRRYEFHSDEMIPIEFSYPEGAADSGKLADLIDRGLPIVVKNGEVQLEGSPLFDFFFEMVGDGNVRLEANNTIEGFANVIRSDLSNLVQDRIDGIPCRVICGQREARIEACLSPELLALKVTVPFGPGGTRPMRMPINLSAWRGLRLMNLPYFDRLLGIFSDLKREDRLAFECIIPGQRFLYGTMNFKEYNPYQDISFILGVLAKAREVAALCSLNPVLPDNYGTKQSINQIHLLHEILVGEGRKRSTPSSRARITLKRYGLKKFLDDMTMEPIRGTLSLTGDGSFPFLSESVHLENLEQVITDMCLSIPRQSLLEELARSSKKQSFCLNWHATEMTQTTLRQGKAAEVPSVQRFSSIA